MAVDTDTRKRRRLPRVAARLLGDASMSVGTIGQRQRRITALAGQIVNRATDVQVLRWTGEILQLANDAYAESIQAQAAIENVPIEAPEV